jgi:hypothetical protein
LREELDGAIIFVEFLFDVKRVRSEGVIAMYMKMRIVNVNTSNIM